MVVLVVTSGVKRGGWWKSEMVVVHGVIGREVLLVLHGENVVKQRRNVIFSIVGATVYV